MYVWFLNSKSGAADLFSQLRNISDHISESNVSRF